MDFQEEFFEDVVWMWEVMDKLLSWYFGKASGATGGGVWELGDMGVFGNGLFPYIHTTSSPVFILQHRVSITLEKAHITLICISFLP